MNQPTFSLTHAADVLGVPERAVSSLVANQALSTLHIGRRVVVSRHELEAWVLADSTGRVATVPN
jgi:excisionase family DNA binding protein